MNCLLNLFIMMCLVFVPNTSLYCPNFSGKNQLSASKTYISGGTQCTNYYPPGYSFVEVSYIYGQTITQRFYQNGQMVGSCFKSKTCNQRILLDPKYKVKIITSRETKLNKYGTYGVHSIEFGKFNGTASNMCDTPPQFNVNNNVNILKCSYEYSESVNDVFVVDMNFDNPITVVVIENGTNKVLLNETSSSIFNKINTTSNYVNIYVSNNNNLTKINQFYLYNLYDDLENDPNVIHENKNTNANALGIAGFVFGLINFLIIIMLLLFLKKKQNSAITQGFSLYYD